MHFSPVLTIMNTYMYEPIKHVDRVEMLLLLVLGALKVKRAITSNWLVCINYVDALRPSQ